MDQKIAVGDLVAFNSLHDTVWFEVLTIDGFHVSVREAGTNYREQWVDRSAVKQVKKAGKQKH